jgi:hypothetical protein
MLGLGVWQVTASVIMDFERAVPGRAACSRSRPRLSMRLAVLRVHRTVIHDPSPEVSDPCPAAPLRTRESRERLKVLP